MFGWLRRLLSRNSAAPMPAAPDGREPTFREVRPQSLPNTASPKPSAIHGEKPPLRPAWLVRMPATVLFVDVETTGLTESDRIISFAGILLTVAELAEGTFNLQYGHYIVNPGRACHPQAADVHGYSDRLLGHQRPFREIAPQVIEMIDQAELIVAHNAKFDMDFINAELTAVAKAAVVKPVFCTLEASRALGEDGSARLDDVAAHIGLARAGPRHGALEDAWLAMMVYLWLHGCPHRIPFTAFSNPRPSNLQPTPPPPPPQPGGFAEAARTLREIFARTGDAPPCIRQRFAPASLDEPDDPEPASDFFGRLDDDLRGITFAIEYTDAAGRNSTRRITLHDLYRDRDGTAFLRCFCHERQARRTFRFDRIRSIIDLDGVVHRPAHFFRDELDTPILRIAPPPQAASPDRPRTSPLTENQDKAGMAQRRIARDGLRLLAALARSDGMMATAEIDIILDFITQQAASAGLETDDEDRSALRGYIKRQRPNADIFEECLARIASTPSAEQRRFLRSAIALVEADGQQDAAEIAMLGRFAGAISR